MADSESIKEIVKQAAVQEFRDSETGPWLATMPNQWENQMQRNRGLVLEKLRFNRDAPDSYVELLNFQLEVTSVLDTRAYEINDDRIPVIKNYLGWEGLLLIVTFTQEEKENVKL